MYFYRTLHYHYFFVDNMPFRRQKTQNIKNF